MLRRLAGASLVKMWSGLASKAGRAVYVCSTSPCKGSIWCNHLFLVLVFVFTQRSVAKDDSNRPPFGHASDGCRKGRLSKRRREGTEERGNE